MGWFDESDDEIEEEPTKPSPATSWQKDDEEDTLDAYMKSLEQPSSSLPSHPRAERLNLENEEEATSHWELPKEQTDDDKVQDAFTDMNHDSQSVAAAQQALASTFTKAGSSSKQGQKEDNQSLEQVQHQEMNYQAFCRDFFPTADTSVGQAWRQQVGVTCTPTTVDPILDFQVIAHLLGEALLEVIQKKGYHKTTPVQAQTLPLALSGKDCLVTASTGSGKTLAYVWPMVIHVCDQRHLETGETGPIGLVLVPTRELALQVEKQCSIMLAPLDGKSMAITGGIGRYKLVQELTRKRGVEVVVATPGRFLDVLSVKKKYGVSLDRVTMVILDESDKMLDMGFEAQVTEILKNIRPDRQSLLLSATMGRKVERVAQKWLAPRYHRIAVGQTGQASEHVEQHVMVLPSYDAKKEWMVEMLPILANVGRTLVFVATRADCETIATHVREKNPTLVIETLHGDKHSSDRQTALKAFSKGKLSALIATDVAARGLDVSNVATVVNFDPAKNLDIHVHRIGRAGRLAKTKNGNSAEQQHEQGTAYTLLTRKNADFAHVLMNAFEREGRQVSTELRSLALKSRRAGNVESRTKWNKAGLGFDKDEHAGSYYGPSDLSVKPPSAKRSRWGP